MKIVVIHGHASTLCEERGSMLQGVVAMGHQVHVLAPADATDAGQRFEEMGVEYALFPLVRTGFTPIADIGSLLHLKQVLFRIRPDMVLSLGTKAAVYGSLAARMAWVGEAKKVFALVTGLGYAFTRESGLKRRLLFGIAKAMHRAGFKSCDGIIFRNDEDESFFRQLGVIPDRVRTTVIDKTGSEQDPATVDNAILSFMDLL